MQQRTPEVSLSHLLLTLVLPVVILYTCSAPGEKWYQLGATPALALALSLPTLAGLWALLRGRARRGLRMPLLGIAAALLTGLVTIYAQTGEGEAMRPSTPWIYAVKEIVAPLLPILVLACSGGVREGGLFRTALHFLLRSLHEPALAPEALAAQLSTPERQQKYHTLLRRCYGGLLGLLCLLAAVKFCIALYFQLPVLQLPAADQAVAYNHAVGAIALCCMVANLPLMALAFWLAVRFLHALRNLASEA